MPPTPPITWGIKHTDEVDLWAGPLEEPCEAARSRGMPDKKIFRAGFLLRPPFYRKLPPDEQANYVRRKWNLDPARPLVVLGTGANGVNRHLQAVAHGQPHTKKGRLGAPSCIQPAKRYLASWCQRH